MNAPTVSIILPTFNRLKYLRAAVDSAFSQSLTDWELIIADDGSDEETRNFLSTLGTLPHVKVLWLPASLARSHAVSGNRSAVLQPLLRSWRYSWRYRQWWRGAVAATAQALAPASMHRAVRRYRGNTTRAQAGAKS